MDVLMLGGTSFIGRQVVEDLLARGHTPTLFNRGRTGSDLFPGVPRLVGDRSTDDYAALRAGRWDAVVDTSGFVPRHVTRAAEALGDHAGRYLFVSTGQVYDHRAATDSIDESSARLAPFRASEEIDDETYGPLKVACEDDLLARFGDRSTVVRPGWVVGPREPTDRLTYWVRRGGEGGRIVVPDRLDRPVQVVDVRDLARLVVLLLEQDVPGAFNAVGPGRPLTFGELIRACGGADLVPVPENDLDFPLLLPDESWDVMFRISAAAAHAVGMPRTPLAKTIADTRTWDLERGRPALSTGLSSEQERALLRTSS
jgi:2'-hydroxyisoflavone reductase